MKYFVRFTNQPNRDLIRATSIHASDDGDHQVLDGLCGYLLESDNLEDAIEEVEEGRFQFYFVGRAVIYTGEVASEDHLVPDGDLFTPFQIVHKFKK